MSECYPTSLEDTEDHVYSEAGGKARYSYDEIHELVRGGASMLREAKFEPDYIISIAGGGLIPARILRSFIDVPILNMTVTSYEGDSHTPTQDPVILQSIDPDIIKNKKVLIVDEVDDTRATIRKVVGEIYNIVDEWGIFVVHNKNKRKDYLVGPHVTYVACENIDGNIWIEYPWDLI